MHAHRNLRYAFALAASLSFSLTAAEKVQIRGSTSIELPKPKHSLEDIRNFKLGEGASGRDIVDGGVAAGTPVENNQNPKADRKLREMLDKQKNWIFQNPYESNLDSKTEKFMEGEKGTGLYDHPLMKGESEDRTLLERYLDEKNPRREDASDPEARERSASRAEMASPERSGNSLQDANGVAVVQDKSLPVQLSFGEKSSPLMEAGQLKGVERPLFNESLFGARKDNSSSINTDEIRIQRESRDSDIVKMLQPRSAPDGTALGNLSRPSPGAGIGGVAPSLGGSPVGPQRSPSSLVIGAGRPQGGPSIGGAQNAPIFTGGGGPGGLSSRPSFDFSSRSSVSSAGSSFAPSAASPISAPRPSSGNSPFNLPFPQRKF